MNSRPAMHRNTVTGADSSSNTGSQENYNYKTAIDHRAQQSQSRQTRSATATEHGNSQSPPVWNCVLELRCVFSYDVVAVDGSEVADAVW